MPRAIDDIADCAGETMRRMPRSSVDRSPGARALMRIAMIASSSMPATKNPSRTLRLPVIACRSNDRTPSVPVTNVLLQCDFPEQVQLVEGPAGAEHDGALGRIGDHHRQAGLLAQQDVQVAQLRPAAREHDAAVDDVGRELGRRPLERERTASTI